MAPHAGRLLAAALALGAVAGPPAHATPLQARGGHGPDPVALDRLREVALGESLPTAWCGATRADDDTEHEVPNGTHKYHAIYAFPSDAADRFQAVAGTLQADAFQASRLLERLYGRALRFDMGTACGAEHLDISAVRLASTTTELRAAAAAPRPYVFDRIYADLQNAGFPVLPLQVTAAQAAGYTKNFLIWLDGPAPAGVCGEADYFNDTRRVPDNWNNFGGKLALVYRNGGGFCNSNTVRHEIGHNLGALLPGAPSAFDGAHCDDAYEDTMCYPLAPRRASGEANALFFDFGNDDYWDPAGAQLPNWSVNLSRFVCPTADCNGRTADARTGVIDGDGDGIPDRLDECPSTRGTTCAATADSTRAAPSRARADVKRRKLKRHRWRLRVRVRGWGRARVRVKCGRRTVRKRVVAVPARLKFRVRCKKRVRVRTRPVKPRGQT